MVEMLGKQKISVHDNVSVNSWINKNILHHTSQGKALIQTACDLIKNKELLSYALMITKILDDLTLDTNSLVAGLVYEAFNNDEISAQTIKKILGDDVHKLVLGIHEIDINRRYNPLKIYNREIIEESKHNALAMSLTTATDIRVIIIKLARHVCFMRTAENVNKETKIYLAYQAKKIYIPLTKRLSIGRLSWELEDLSFKFLQPATYKNIAKLLDERRVDREKYIASVKKELERNLKLHSIDSNIYGRPKHIYSIWDKMQRKMIDYNELYDIHALRVIVPGIVDCYSALGIVHSLWRHIPTKFDDYISNPKSNGYKSLHTAVIGPYGKILEIQFRTKQFDREAEIGVAAHWRYKGCDQHELFSDKTLIQLRRLLNWQN